MRDEREEARAALHEFVKAIADALHVYAALDWLEARLRRLKRR